MSTTQKTVREVVTDARLKAREILRARQVNHWMNTIWNNDKRIELEKETIEKNKKALEIATYELITSLDENHPNFEQTLKENVKTIEDKTERTNQANQEHERNIETLEKTTRETENKINTVDTEWKASIEEIAELTESLLLKQ